MFAAALGLVGLKTVQSVLTLLAALLPLTSWRFPVDTPIQGNQVTVDYIVVGGGTAGSIVAARLSENSNVTVALIEAGGDPPLESVLPALFPVEPLMYYDYNYLAANDFYTSQHVMGHVAGMTAGKLLGGTSSMSHTLFLRGCPYDYEQWVEITGDDSWSYDNLLPYFKKCETVEDEKILKSSTGDLHGTNGNLGLTVLRNPISDDYIDALGELGYELNPDVNSKHILGVSHVYHLIANGVRQDGAQSYLGPAKDRSNLEVYKKTTVVKILFDDNKNAIGVEAVTEVGKKVKFYAKKEVLLAAGVVKSPQLLMLSGVGPADHLKKFNIPVLSDLPVGKNLRDRIGLLIAYKMGASDAPKPPMNPHKFPIPTTVAYKASDPSQSYPDVQLLNFIVSHDNAGLLMLCSNVIKYQNPICDKFHQANVGHQLYLAAISNSHPVSTGEVLLKDTNPLSQPYINLGLLSNSTDLEVVANFLLDLTSIQNTTFFKNVSAEFVDPGLLECILFPKDTLAYWKCYVVAMSSTFWQYCGTNAMGSVTDNQLKVNGVQRLRVVDASAAPSPNSGEIMAAVIALAEKASDLIKNDMDKLEDLNGGDSE